MMNITNLPPVKFFRITFPLENVAHVEINRPEKLNAFFDPMWYELKAVFDFISHHPDIRVVLLSGAGERAFTAGLDVTAAAQPDSVLNNNKFVDPSRKATHLRRHILELQDTVSAVSRCEKPVICLMHGFAYGLGIDLSTACDIRLCSPNTRFCVKEVDIGLAADVGTLSRLPKVLGGLTSWAKEICCTARPFDAAEADKNNFVSRVVPGGKKELVDEGLKLARLLATKSPVAVQGTKAILDAAWGRTVEENLHFTSVWNAGMLQSTDVTSAVGAGMKGKTPIFAKL